ncbi:tripartite tricarboxylate transporter substrate-binding protein [Bradyrhizobium genosp. P]|uniref:tripartite tricarboxylate transporter substrate-binding protein n=1 Tax=Bradyrhizobium genosp. P TaxID=83641 RepID=UPI003CED213A
MTGRWSADPSRRAVLRAGVALAAAAATASHAGAADYPERPIKIIVPFAPGGPTDIMARILGTYLGEALNGTIVVENRPGGGGNIGIGIAAHAEPDGHALLITSSAYVVNPGLYAKNCVRSIQGLCSDRRAGYLAQRDSGQSEARNQFGRRPDHSRKGQSGRIELRQPLASEQRLTFRVSCSRS